MSVGTTSTGTDHEAACKCGLRSNCPGHTAMRQSAYDNGYYPPTDSRITSTKGFDLTGRKGAR